MRIIYNNLLPCKGFRCVNVFGVLFAREGAAITKSTLNHESIHTAQMRELGYILFYIIYFLEWLFRLVFHTKTAYRGISFEVEAYDHQYDHGYLATRRHYAQWRRSK